MFSKIRIHLTFLYSGIMAVFLSAFVIAALSGLTWAVYWSEKNEVLGLAEEEVHEQAVVLKNPHLKTLLQKDAEENVSNGTLFVYVYDNEDRLVAVERAHQSVEEGVLRKVEEWRGSDEGVITVSLERSGADDAILMMTMRHVIHGGQIIGKVYVGRDVTFYYHSIKKVIFMLAGISLIFLFFASCGGYIIAGRTMVPIKKSYNRQRQFVADASHELRTPLSVLMSSVEAVNGDEMNRLSPFSAQILADMKDEIRKMTKIVGNMLTLARADALAISVSKEKINLTAVIEQVVRSLQPLAQEKGINLLFETKEAVFVVVDQERLRQVLLILLDNGIKYTPAMGWVSISLETTKPLRQVKIIVSDSGIGIAPEWHEQIFERFFRVDKARSREVGGSGLGLAIAKWIVESHGGVMQVKSAEGQGSAFSVILPQ